MENEKQNNAIVLSPDIQQRFDISWGAGIPEFSTEFADALSAKSKTDTTSPECYAIVFHNSFAADLDKLSILREIEGASIQRVIDFGKVNFRIYRLFTNFIF